MGFFSKLLDFMDTAFGRTKANLSRGSTSKNRKAQFEYEEYKKKVDYYNESVSEWYKNGSPSVQEWLKRNEQFIDPLTGKIDYRFAEYNQWVHSILLERLMKKGLSHQELIWSEEYQELAKWIEQKRKK